MKYIFYTMIISQLLFSDSTICFKNNWKNLATIEEQIFNGGKCKNIHTITKMKKLSWEVSDIKIIEKNNSFNFIYILKKNNSVKQTIDYKEIANNLKINEKNIEIEKNISDGKRVYNLNCKSCHGEIGELEPYNSSVAINTLTIQRFQEVMRAYNWDEYDNGFAMIMKPYAELAMPYEIDNIYKYLQTLKKK